MFPPRLRLTRIRRARNKSFIASWCRDLWCGVGGSPGRDAKCHPGREQTENVVGTLICEQQYVMMRRRYWSGESVIVSTHVFISLGRNGSLRRRGATNLPREPISRRNGAFRSGRCGFTLIELLVVIAIIAVLAA